MNASFRLESMPPAERANDVPQYVERVCTAIADMQEGKMVILVDDEDRENEGDLCLAADKVTPQSINFMATHGRGLICLALTGEQVQRLGLPLMQLPDRAGPPLGTAFTVSIEARQGVTTGISASDRARTILVASSPEAKPEDIVVPGHVLPLRARTGGVLVRAGQTEGSVDLARLAAFNPAGVICEIMNDDGTMARMPDLERFARRHGLHILSIADLISYRLQTERLVECIEEADIVLDRTHTTWHARVYQGHLDGSQVFALVKGQPDRSGPVLCRMHGGSVLADVFSSTAEEGGHNLSEAIDAIEQEGAGVIVYLPSKRDLRGELRTVSRPPPDPRREVFVPPAAPGSAAQGAQGGPRGTLREYGLGAAVLRDLGLCTIRLLTNNPRKIAGIMGYGLEVAGCVPLVPMRRSG
ncbi:MAG: 3,4-dihydroxy-2-butanone-4-phosphate synthase [Polyangiaceae bacterium]|nr:3,4-dihydroxy-2-butanone-4-phosphate synthase [Polyangiaceae bacterium]